MSYLVLMGFHHENSDPGAKLNAPTGTERYDYVVEESFQVSCWEHQQALFEVGWLD